MRIDETGLGSIIKAARLKKGLTQEALAEKSGVGPRHMMGIENEGSYPSYEVLFKLIRELNISADSVFYPEKNQANPRFEYLVHLLRQCGDRDLRAITALAESLLSKSEDSG